MLRLAICDDNLNELSHMERLIAQYGALRHVPLEIAVFSSGFELAFTLSKGNTFHIYCLDILMPGFDGIALAKEIRAADKSARILFFTSSPEFALEGYSVSALNYMLKPVTEEKLFLAFDTLLEHMRIEEESAAVIVKSSEGLQKILLSNLVYAEVIGRSVLYHTYLGKRIECAESFSAVCDSLLKHGHFIKTHRAYIVNMQYIDAIERNAIKLQTQDIVPIAQGKAREIRQKYLAYQMEDI